MRDFIEFIGFSIATVIMLVFMVALMVAASTAPIWVTLLLVKMLFFTPTEGPKLSVQLPTEKTCTIPAPQAHQTAIVGLSDERP